MKKWLCYSTGIIAMAMIVSCSVPRQSLQLVNATDQARQDELIVLTRAEVQRITGKLPAQKYIIITRSGQAGPPVLVQHDDLDKDGVWDEIAFMVSPAAWEKNELKLEPSDAPATIKAVVRAHVRHRRKMGDNTFGPDLDRDSVAGQLPTDFTKHPLPPFLTEGPAWENDKVGFRYYFDERNCKDIWGKTTPRMVLDEVGTDPASSYHHLSDWGMDILKVGKSLGAGALAVHLSNINGRDTLLRLGGISMGPIIYEKVADGPLRAIFRMHYPAWHVPGRTTALSLTEEIHIWAGQYFYESRVVLNGAREGDELVTGIVNLYDLPAKRMDTPDASVLYTFGKQSENNDNLGLAILVGKGTAASFGVTPGANSDVVNTYTTLFPGHKATFRFYAAWQKSDPRFGNESSFADFLKTEAFKFSHPVSAKR
ncbi:DUF4861 domain-containing protein [Nostoc ellipsosporum NOK]|nr:DUF4861 domain-containing protein [Nostoc ellipsosporum NOK]